jgi:hypothetical protein
VHNEREPAERMKIIFAPRGARRVFELIDVD